MSTFSELFARLDPDPKVRGKQFEHVCKWFLTNEPTYKNTLRRVWLWNEWTGRGGGDAGIDLVAEDRDGRLRAASEYRGQPGRVHQQPTTTSMFTVMPGSPYVEP